MEEVERAGKGGGVEGDVVGEENVEDDVVEDKDVDVADDDDEKGSEGGTGDKEDVAIDVVEGETLKVIVEGEIPVETEERDPYEGKSPMNTDVEEPESEGLKDIVDLVDGPDNEDTPVKERMARRMTRRRSMLDEVDESTRPGKLQFGAQGAGVKAGEEVPEPEEDLTEAETRRLAAERKRKGKQEIQVLPKKPRKTPATEPTEEPMPETIRVPFVKELEGPGADSEAEDDDEAEQTEELNYEMIEVLVTKKLLEAMADFDDLRRAQSSYRTLEI